MKASTVETKRGQPGVNPGSTWGQPGVNVVSICGQPGVHLGSTLGSTWVQPGVNLHHPTFCTVLFMRSACCRCPFSKRLMDGARHVIRGHFTQEMRVQNAFDDWRALLISPQGTDDVAS